MKKRMICAILLGLLLLMGGCATLRAPQYLNPEYKLNEVQEITVLCAVDCRVDKSKTVSLYNDITCPMAKDLTKKQYIITPRLNCPETKDLTYNQIRSATVALCDSLEKYGRFVMMPVLLHLNSKGTVSSVGTAILAVYLLDTQRKLVVMSDIVDYRFSYKGLSEVVKPGVVAQTTLVMALAAVMRSIPPRGKPFKA